MLSVARAAKVRSVEGAAVQELPPIRAGSRNGCNGAIAGSLRGVLAMMSGCSELRTPTGHKSPLGVGHTCGTRTDHTLWCWGDNGYGQVGLGDDPNERLPPSRSAPTPIGERIAPGWYDTCGTRDDRTLWWCGTATTASSTLGLYPRRGARARRHDGEVHSHPGWQRRRLGSHQRRGGLTCAISRHSHPAALGLERALGSARGR